MSNQKRTEKLVESTVTYTLYKDGQLYVIENVPARVDEETGEQYFSPQTVEQLQSIIIEHRKPSRFIQTPVYDFV
jgi:YgiT-type zinc finger domain-containing protein